MLKLIYDWEYPTLVSVVQYSAQRQTDTKNYKYQRMIPLTNNQKLITCKATTISCEFHWLYHANFRLKQKISISSEKNHGNLKPGFAQISLAAQKI